MEHNKPNWDKLQAISVLTSDSPFLGPALKKNPYDIILIYIYIWLTIELCGSTRIFLHDFGM